MVSKASRVGSVSQLRDGLLVLLGKSGTVRMDGKEVKLRDILDVLDKLALCANATAKAKAAYSRAVADERAATAQTGPVVLAVRTQLLGSYSAEQLAVCGVAPRKSIRRLSSAERTAATAKARATRAARGRKSAKAAREEAALADIVAAYGAHESGPKPGAPEPPRAKAWGLCSLCDQGFSRHGCISQLRFRGAV